MTNNHLKTSLAIGYDRALDEIPSILKEHGFGVITRIDMGATVKEKLGLDFRRYTIFGACNPVLAHRALVSDPDVGILLPCNVAVYEDGGGHTVVTILDPLESLAHDGEAALREIAAEARTMLGHVLFKLSHISAA